MNEIIDNFSQDFKSKVTSDIGIGRAIFDKDLNPTKRYFLEKSWEKNGDKLTIIMTNPSTASSLASDKTVNFLLKFANNNNYAGIYIINIIPYIGSKFCKIKKERGEENIIESVCESPNVESFKYALTEADNIILAWGKDGQIYFKDLIKSDEEIKKLFTDKNKIFKAFGFSERKAFPYHPLPNGIVRFGINNSDLIDARPFLDGWAGI